jgi:hypothetical protein
VGCALVVLALVLVGAGVAAAVWVVVLGITAGRGFGSAQKEKAENL